MYFSKSDTNSLIFPGREPIPQWRILSDRIITPILGIIITFIFTSTILNSTPSWIYSLIFSFESILFLILGIITKSESKKYSFLSLSAYFFITSIFSLIIVILFK